MLVLPWAFETYVLLTAHCPLQLRELAQRSAAKAQAATRGAQGRMLNLPHFKKQVAAAAQEKKMRRQSLEAAEGGAAEPGKEAGSEDESPTPAKPLHLLLFPWLDPDRHQETGSSQATHQPHFNTFRTRAVAQVLHLPPAGGKGLAAAAGPELPSAECSAVEPAGAGAAAQVSAAPSASSEASPHRCSGAGSKDCSAAAKELAPAALPQQPSKEPQQPGASGEPPPAWRRLGSWLLSIFTCDLKWKGVIDKPLADFESESAALLLLRFLLLCLPGCSDTGLPTHKLIYHSRCRRPCRRCLLLGAGPTAPAAAGAVCDCGRPTL